MCVCVCFVCAYALVCLHMCVYMYVCYLCACLCFVCMCVWMDVWIDRWMAVWMCICTYVCMYVCMYVCNVCMYVCMYVCMEFLRTSQASNHVCMYTSGGKPTRNGNSISNSMGGRAECTQGFFSGITASSLISVSYAYGALYCFRFPFGPPTF